MKWIYFKWSGMSTIFLIVTMVLFLWYLFTEINLTGFLGLVVLYIARGIMWTGWDKDEIVKLNKEIEFLKKQI